MRSNRTIPAVLCLLAFASSAGAAVKKPAKPSAPIVMVIGFVAFNSGDSAYKPSQKKEFVKEFLQRASENSQDPEGGGGVRFDVVQGNYYQVLHWLRTGSIDGAVLSPFSYDVLLGEDNPDDPAGPIAAVTFPTAGIAGENDGGRPMFRALVDGVPSDDPDAVVHRCVRPEADCTFSFVSHLSTTGFICPLMQLYPDGHPGRLPFADLLKRTRFTLWHSTKPDPNAPPASGTSIQYTYSGDLIGRSADEKWRPLEVDIKSFPHDTLVLMRKGRMQAYAESVGELLRLQAIHEADRAPRRSAPIAGYHRVEPANPEDFNEFHEAVQRLAERSEIKPYWTLWYTEEKYDFSVAEVVDLLHNDQRVNGRERASIVLPGGGVRGAYQATVLDELYDHHVLNDGWSGALGLHPKLNDRLKINSVIGTSGGALMGYLAARRSPCDPKKLTSRWDGIQPTDVFPKLSVLRFLSILVALIVFGLAAALFTGRMDRVEGSPFWLTIGFAVTLLFAPALMWRLSQLDFLRHASLLAGISYLALLLILHGMQTTLKKPDGADGLPKTVIPRRVAATIAGGAGLLIAVLTAYALLFSHFDPQLRDTQGAEPTLAISSILLATASIVLIARAAGAEFDPAITREYFHGMATALLFLLLTTAAALLLTWIDFATVLELTHDYWMTVAIAAAVAALITVLLRRWSPTLRIGTDFWVRPHTAGPFLYTPILTLLLGGFIGVAAWVLLVAPALYNGEVGHESFAQQAATVGRERTRFVAPITALEGSSELEAGDYYAIESGNQPPRFLRFPSDRFLQAVSASGSPFPIYPGRPVQYRDTVTVFTDGGFAHLVPVEGAVLLGAKQVLIVGNAARRDRAGAAPKPKRILSVLLSGSGTVFNYLFERSQLADLNVEGDVLIASIAPEWTREDWKVADPFLMDFQPRTVEDLIKTGRENAMFGRPARVLRWGAPVLLDTDAMQIPPAPIVTSGTYRCNDRGMDRLSAGHVKG